MIKYSEFMYMATPDGFEVFGQTVSVFYARENLIPSILKDYGYILDLVYTMLKPGVFSKLMDEIILCKEK